MLGSDEKGKQVQILYELVTVIREFAANKSLILIGKAAVSYDFSARRPALYEATTTTRNWFGMDR